jgi:hypothetical protein
MKKAGILMLITILISFGIVFAKSRQNISLTPNLSYAVTLLVRSTNLTASGILSKDNLKISVEKNWKVEPVPGEEGLWRLTGKFTLPYSIGNMPLPEGAGRLTIDEVSLETIDGEKAN